LVVAVASMNRPFASKSKQFEPETSCPSSSWQTQHSKNAGTTDVYTHTWERERERERSVIVYIRGQPRNSVQQRSKKGKERESNFEVLELSEKQDWIGLNYRAGATETRSAALGFCWGCEQTSNTRWYIRYILYIL
jgi:hypothetical protein